MKTLEIENGIKTLDKNYKFDKDIEKIVFPSSIEEILPETFEYCNNLREIVFLGNTLPNIYFNAFKICSNIENMVINAETIDFNNLNVYSKTVTLTKNVKKINTTFAAYTNNFIVDKDNENLSSYDGLLYNKNYSKLLKCPNHHSSIINLHNSCKIIAKHAFKSINIDSIDLTNIELIKEYAFKNCNIKNLVSLGTAHFKEESIFNCVINEFILLGNPKLDNYFLENGPFICEPFTKIKVSNEVYQNNEKLLSNLKISEKLEIEKIDSFNYLLESSNTSFKNLNKMYKNKEKENKIRWKYTLKYNKIVKSIELSK